MSDTDENENSVILSLDDQVKAQQGQGDIDVDILTVKVLILCHQKDKMDSIGTFLNRRGWETAVTTKLEQAIKVMASDRPDFVMISMNHPNKKVSKLPQFIQQTFNTRVMVYGEKADSKTIGLIHAAKTPHKVMGMVSGPSIHRKIKQILNEIYNKKPEPTSTMNLNSDVDGAAQTVGGSKASDHPAVQRFSQEDNSGSLSSSEGNTSYFAKGESANLAGSGGYFPNQSTETSGSTNQNGEENGMASGDNEGMNSGMGLFSGTLKQNEGSLGSEKDLEKSGVYFQKNEKLKQGASYTKDPTEENSDTAYGDGEGDEGFSKSSSTTNTAGNSMARGEAAQGKMGGIGQLGNKEENSTPRFSNQTSSKGNLATREAEQENGIEQEDLENDIFNDEMDGFGLFTPAVANSTASNQSEERAEAEGALGSDYLDSESSAGVAASKIKKGEYLDAHKDKEGSSESLNALAPQHSEGQAELQKSSLKDGPLGKSEYQSLESFDSVPKEKKFFLEAVENALSGIVRKEIGIQPELYNKNKFIGVIPLQSSEFNGYFLISTNSKEFDLQSFATEFLEKFDKEIHKNEITVYFSEAFVLTLEQEIKLYDFAKSDLSFAVLEQYPQEEVMVTYLECGRPIPEVFQKIGHIKSQVKVEDIPANFPLEFNAFLHLKKNKKYFLFIRENNKLLTKQKNRLIDRKVDVYINRDDVESFKKTFAKSEISDTLNNYLISLGFKAAG